MGRQRKRVCRRQNCAISAENIAGSAAKMQAWGMRMRVLLAEDEHLLAEAIRRLLEHYMVDVSVNGLDGLDNVLSGIYDAMVLVWRLL